MIVNEDRTNPVQVKQAEWRGQRRLDIRHIFYREDGEVFPTKKGVAIPEEDIPSFIEAIQGVVDEMGTPDE